MKIVSKWNIWLFHFGAVHSARASKMPENAKI
jgi:hypothetical protein